MAEFIFSQIKNYGFMHSSYFITNAVIEATKEGLKSMLVYLDSRYQEVYHTFDQKTQHDIKDSMTFDAPAVGEYGMLATKIWAPESAIKKDLFDRSKALQPMDMKYLDIPFIFRPTHEGFEFIDALLETNQLEIFGLKSVQTIIDSHHDHWQWKIMLFIGLPILLQLLVF